jgi:predicted transcriptional regulator
MLSKLEQEIERMARHIAILRLVVEEGPIGIIKLSELSRCPQHKVRYSLRILEQRNLIKPSSQGAVATPKAKKFVKTLPRKIKQLSEKLENL